MSFLFILMFRKCLQTYKGICCMIKQPTSTKPVSRIERQKKKRIYEANFVINLISSVLLTLSLSLSSIARPQKKKMASLAVND